MLIRYHLFYYAVGSLLLILGRYIHFVFYIYFLIYLFWLFHRFSLLHALICGCIAIVIWVYPHSIIDHAPTDINGTVKRVSENYSYVQTEYGMMKLYHDETLQYNDEIKAKIKYMDINEATNDYAFDEKNYLYSQKIFLKARIVKLYEVKHHASFYHFLDKRLSLDSDSQSYQRLLILGNKDEDVQTDYQILSQLSLVHLFALSGMHVHLLFAFIIFILGLFIDQKYARFIAYGLIGFYIFSIPIQISLYRAYLMIVLYDILKKYINELDVFGLLIIISLLYNPYIIYHPSFIFSYGIYFIVLLTRKMKSSYFLISFASIPLILYFQSGYPVLSIFLGMILAPFIEFFYIVCWVSIFFPFFQSLLMVCVGILKNMITFLDNINFSIYFSKPSFLFFMGYYCLYFSLLIKQQFREKQIVLYSIMLSFMISFWFYGQYKINGEITMIDVGQGDCTLIRLPFNQGNILIDTGGNKNYDVATQIIIPYLYSSGIHYLDYVYISHDDFDHSGALNSLIDHFDVRHVIREYEPYRKIGNIEIRMLEHQYSSDSNDQSLVMIVDFGQFQMLMTGDISLDVEKELIEKYPEMNIDILKVSHHGSLSATSPELFTWIQPSIAMIGVGQNNRYHHPHQQVIERLKRKGITILRTDQDGMFHIQYNHQGKYWIYR